MGLHLYAHMPHATCHIEYLYIIYCRPRAAFWGAIHRISIQINSMEAPIASLRPATLRDSGQDFPKISLIVWQ